MDHDDIRRVRCRGYELVTYGLESTDPDDGNIDVEVHISGERYGATFFTPVNVSTLLARHRESGEDPKGAYWWTPDMVLVGRITEGTLVAAVDAMLVNGELPRIMVKLEASPESGKAVSDDFSISNHGEVVSGHPLKRWDPNQYDERAELAEYLRDNYLEHFPASVKAAWSAQILEEKAKLIESGAMQKVMLSRASQARREAGLLPAEDLQPFLERTANELLTQIHDSILINRCPRCARIVATPRARQCLWCGYDWHGSAR